MLSTAVYVEFCFLGWGAKVLCKTKATTMCKLGETAGATNLIFDFVSLISIYHNNLLCIICVTLYA